MTLLCINNFREYKFQNILIRYSKDILPIQIPTNLCLYYNLDMLKNLLLVLLLLTVITAIKKHDGACTLQVRLRSIGGKYLHRNNQIAHGTDVLGTQTDAASVWGLEVVNPTTVRFVDPNTGLYLAPCNNCRAGAAYPYSALAHGVIARDGGWVNWTWQKQADGTYVFTGLNGKALAPCNGCARTSFSYVPFVHSTAGDGWSHWTLQYVGGI